MKTKITPGATNSKRIKTNPTKNQIVVTLAFIAAFIKKVHSSATTTGHKICNPSPPRPKSNSSLLPPPYALTYQTFFNHLATQFFLHQHMKTSRVQCPSTHIPIVALNGQQRVAPGPGD
jgi:hypothetical protein